ncbi:MAG: circularly permuted type 2 ATP-grasp protein [Candidatus Obscuribacterales bacterium]|nr:circularly permuted type 2 ATP-grasp protein [Candidatus Obscuribacterales bacterium]
MSSGSKVEWLSWKGYSEKKRVSLNGWLNGFSFPSRLFERVPFCIESYDVLREKDTDERLAIQSDLFERTNHSVMATQFMGIIRSKENKWLREQISLCLKTMIKLMQIVSVDDIDGPALKQLLDVLPAKTAEYLRSSLESSLYFYANGKVKKPFARVEEQALYIELGVDILASGLNFMMAEFQVRYATPYAHLIDDMSAAYQAIFPGLFKKFGLKAETFSTRRRDIFNACAESFTAMSGEPVARVLVDAWAYENNSGANLKRTAEQLGMDYVLFDELSKTQNLIERTYRNKRLCIFNQAPLNLLDPSDLLFQRVNAEQLENYDELSWTGLLQRYLDGQVFMANSPMTDLLNDKALYAAIPDLARHFFGETLELSISEDMACWSPSDYHQVHEANLNWAKNNKNKAVIAHRYLEGGLGIRVGPATSAEEWESFIETFVCDRPYLYVVRKYFPMDPDFSLRLIASSSLKNLSEDLSNFKAEYTDTIFARLTTQSPLSAENHRSFLIFQADDSKIEPRYEFKEESSR